MQPFRLPPFEIADDRSAYQRQLIEVEGESSVAQCMVEVFLRPPLPLHELITILNRCHRFQGFIYQHAHFTPDKKTIEISVSQRKGSAAILTTGKSHIADLIPG